jgi:septin 7
MRGLADFFTYVPKIDILFSWKPILDDIESRYDSYHEQENRVNRKKIVDTRIHACLYFIQPTGHA